MAYILFSLLLAAATLGVPVAVFPSCTPKGMMVRPLTASLSNTTCHCHLSGCGLSAALLTDSADCLAQAGLCACCLDAS